MAGSTSWKWLATLVLHLLFIHLVDGRRPTLLDVKSSIAYVYIGQLLMRLHCKRKCFTSSRLL
jgi:hypothetical protein